VENILHKVTAFITRQGTDGVELLLFRHPHRVYSRPDTTSLDWASFRRGVQVRMERQQGEFIQVTYEEPDRLPSPNYITYCIIGWVPAMALTNQVQRHYFHLTSEEQSPSGAWITNSDNHSFRLFWASMMSLPDIIYPQNTWLKYVQEHLAYTLR
jgi:hypothetical protein